jgi:hypothetical protein
MNDGVTHAREMGHLKTTRLLVPEHLSQQPRISGVILYHQDSQCFFAHGCVLSAILTTKSCKAVSVQSNCDRGWRPQTRRSLTDAAKQVFLDTTWKRKSNPGTLCRLKEGRRRGADLLEGSPVYIREKQKQAGRAVRCTGKHAVFFSCESFCRSCRTDQPKD